MASTPAQTTVDGATSGLQTDLLAVGGTGLGVGVVIYAVKKGWSFFRSMV